MSTQRDEPDCFEAVQELYVYLDGHLDESRRIAIHSHLVQCGPCLSTFDFHEELKRIVSMRCRTEMPTGLRDRVFAALESFDDSSNP